MHLNLPLQFTAETFEGGILTFEGNPKNLATKNSALSSKLRELRDEHDRTHVFHASGNTIACVPLTADARLIGEAKRFDVHTDFQLANALARAAIFRFFSATGTYTIIGFRPVTLLLRNHKLASARQDVFGIFPEYRLDVRSLAPHEGDITSGVLISFGIHYAFLKNLADLATENVPLTGLVAVRIHEDDEEDDISTEFRRHYLGKIEAIADGNVILSDSEVERFPANQCYLEGSRRNFEVVGRALLADKYEDFSGALLQQTFNVMGAEQQVERLDELGKWLQKRSPISCTPGLAVNTRSPTIARKEPMRAPPTPSVRPSAFCAQGVRSPSIGQWTNRSTFTARMTPNRSPTSALRSR